MMESTDENNTMKTIDMHGSSPHQAFFYIECTCNAWFAIELLIRLGSSTISTSLQVLELISNIVVHVNYYTLDIKCYR